MLVVRTLISKFDLVSLEFMIYKLRKIARIISRNFYGDHTNICLTHRKGAFQSNWCVFVRVDPSQLEVQFLGFNKLGVCNEIEARSRNCFKYTNIESRIILVTNI